VVAFTPIRMDVTFKRWLPRSEVLGRPGPGDRMEPDAPAGRVESARCDQRLRMGPWKGRSFTALYELLRGFALCVSRLADTYRRVSRYGFGGTSFRHQPSVSAALTGLSRPYPCPRPHSGVLLTLATLRRHIVKACVTH